MNTLTSYTPSWISSPGDTISDILYERKISLCDFQKNLNIPESKVKQLIDGKLQINSTIAEKLSVYLGASKSFWLEREKQYRENKIAINKELTEREESWVSSLPTREMKKLGWLPNTFGKFQEFLYCLDFFDAQNLDDWTNNYQSKKSAIAFKTSQHFTSIQGSIDAWIRQGEILSAHIQSDPWNKEKFISKLPEIRKLTREKSPSVFLIRLQELCASCGVVVVIVKAPTGCKASGATKFIRKDKAMIVMSFRHLSDDHFWFTFFHEAGHLILHDSNLIFIDDDTVGIDEQFEIEANDFSRYTLIPKKHEGELYKIANDWRQVLRFARDLGISPGVVVGQLQKRKIIPYNHLNRLKTKFKWL